MTDTTAWARVVFCWGDDCRIDLVLGGPDAPDLAVVEGLARLELVARRSGGAMFLHDVAPVLDGLLDLVGLRGEMRGQPRTSR
jgi:hypothetical protein